VIRTSAIDENEVGASPCGLGLEGDVELVEGLARLPVGLGVLDPSLQGAPVLRHPEVADGALMLALEAFGGGHLQAVLLHHEPRRRHVRHGQRQHQEQRAPRRPPHPAQTPGKPERQLDQESSGARGSVCPAGRHKGINKQGFSEGLEQVAAVRWIQEIDRGTRIYGPRERPSRAVHKTTTAGGRRRDLPRQAG
jgi:hypothetical protein